LATQALLCVQPHNNAFTETLKGRLEMLPGRTQALHGLLDAACGLAVSQN
jgi:hypothetical protein